VKRAFRDNQINACFLRLNILIHDLIGVIIRDLHNNSNYNYITLIIQLTASISILDRTVNRIDLLICILLQISELRERK